jgi:RNA polymerase sigma-70 factor (ECF subfamily)
VTDLDAHLRAIVAGDTTAFAQWVAGAEHSIRLSLARYATRVDVEVVVQEALLRVWNVAPRVKLDGRGNSLLRFAVRTARNLAIDELRRLRHSTIECDDDADFVLPVEPDPLLRNALRECRDQLPPQPRKAFDARLEAPGGETDESLAARVGMQLNTFFKNFGRARALLVECLRRGGIELEETAP